MKKFNKLNDAIMNPAFNFINKQQKDTQPKTTQIENTKFKIIDDNEHVVEEIELPKGTKIKNIIHERRTKRVQLVMQPSKFNQMKKHCQQNNISVNDFINTLIANYFNKQKE